MCCHLLASFENFLNKQNLFILLPKAFLVSSWLNEFPVTAGAAPGVIGVSLSALQRLQEKSAMFP
jgi:hypothetical protein